MNEQVSNNKQISICIPRVDETVTNDYIRKTFIDVLFGSKKPDCNIIEKIDLIGRSNEKGETYKRAFIHFCNWDVINTENSIAIWDKLHAGEIIKVMHNQPNYWKCSMSRVPRPNKLDDHRKDNHKQKKIEKNEKIEKTENTEKTEKTENVEIDNNVTQT